MTRSRCFFKWRYPLSYDLTGNAIAVTDDEQATSTAIGTATVEGVDG